ncbi:MAG: AarF/ABC1/UbiB kinase family protein [Syntrophorhabdales bacterium]|jgi:ubiquinone biosynthesis protein
MRIASLHRLRFILTTIVLFGGAFLVGRLRLLHLVPWRLRIRAFLHPREAQKRLFSMEGGAARISPAVVRELLERLGPTFVKLGQILSLRADFVGEDLSRELSRLQSDVAPFSFDHVERIIEEDLGRPSDQVFHAFDRQPVAAASLAQVHRAFLHDGTEVAVKVQRPDIRKTIEQDIQLLLYLGRIAERFVPSVRPYNPVQVVREFADWTGRELDFSVEGHSAERFRFAFRDNPHIKIPVIYWDYTSRRILTMEYIHGVRADDIAAIEREGLDRRELALCGVDAQLQQILIDGFFHADPHPGNSFAMGGNRLCFYDFGMVGYLKEKQRRELVSCLVAFANRDIERFLAHFLHLARVTGASEVAAFEKDASQILSEVFFSPTNPSIAWIFFRLINRGAARLIGFPADLALFSKALITTEAMGRALYPDFDFNEHLTPFVKKAFETYIDPALVRRSLANDFIDYAAFLKELPERLQAVMMGFERREGIGVRLDERDLTLLGREMGRHADRRTAEVSLLVLAFLVAVMLVTGAREGPAVSLILDGGIGLFLALFLLFLARARGGK